MIDFVHKDLFLQNSVKKNLFITSGNITITNTELHNEKFSIKESLCSQSDLVFGSCEASELEFTVSNIFTSLVGKTLTVEMAVNGDLDNKMLIGKYKVHSDKPTANRRDRNVKAYDFMYDILNADVAEWYNTILPTADSKVTVAEFRESFLAYFGLSAKEIVLINDDMYITRTIDPATLSGKDVITKICEINACFGHIGRSGDFEFIYLQPMIKGLYPSEDIYPSETLYPSETNAFTVGTRNIISANAEDYLCANITRVQVRQDSDDIGSVCGTEGNDYIIQDNFLLYGKSQEELDTVAQRIFDVVKLITYRPFNAEVNGNPCVEVGDLISIGTKYMIIDSYVLERTLKGIQSLRDSIHADGQPVRKERVNGTNSEITQIKGKYNRLTRTVDETRLEMSDIEKGLRNEISITSEGLNVEIERATQAEAQLGIRADTIQLSVTDLQTDTEATFTTLSNEISLKVSSSDLISEINLSNEAIKLSSGRLIITAGNFTLDKYGNICATGGSIGDFVIDGGALDSGSGVRIYYNGVMTDYLEAKSISLRPNDTGNVSIVTYADVDIYGDYNLKINNPLKVNNDFTANSATIGGISFSGLENRVCAIEDNLTITSGGSSFTISVKGLRDAIIDLEERVSALEAK